MSHAATVTSEEATAESLTQLDDDHKPVPLLRRAVVVGTICGLLCALFGTAANIALRYVATPHDMDWAMLVAFVKALPTLLTALFVVLAILPVKERAFLKSRPAGVLFLIGLTTQFGGNLAFQYALGLGGLGLTVCLCFATLILTGATLGRVLLGEPIRPRSAVGIVILVAAIAALTLGAGEATNSVLQSEASTLEILGAVLAACLSGFAFASCGVAIRRNMTQQVSSSMTLLLITAGGVVGLAAGSLTRLGVDQIVSTPSTLWLVMLLAGVFNTLALYLLTRTYRLLPVIRVNALTSTQTAMAAIAGVAIFGESLTAWLVVGILLTITGLAIGSHRGSQ